MIRLEEMLNKLENIKPSGEGYTAKCPCHDDQKNSLSIKESAEGKILLHCFAGCEFSDIVNSLGYSKGDLMSNKKANNKIVATYGYFDEYYNLLYQVVRVNPKSFFQRRPNDKGGWTNGLGDVRRVPYNLPEVVSSIKRNEIIFWPEGEKDADNIINKLELVATTTPMGASGWKEDYADYFYQADVVLLPDEDVPGEKYAQTVAKALEGKAARVRILKLPGLNNKEDISDWISRGGTKNELLDLIKELSDYEIIDVETEKRERIIFPCTDLGNAERFVKQFGSNIRFCYEAKKWLVWNGVIWEWDESNEIERKAKSVVRTISSEDAIVKELDKDLSKEIDKWAKESEKRSAIRNMIELAKSECEIPISRSQLDEDGMLINCLNGTLDLKTGFLREHRKEDYITMLAKVNYDPNVESEIFDKFLERILPDRDLRNFVQVAAGYSITGDTSEEKLFLCYGPPASGKSTLFAGIQAALGDYASVVNPETFLEKKGNSGGAANSDIARLAGKRYVFGSEIDDGKKMAQSLVKQITSGDIITARFLHQEFFMYKPVLKLWLASNFRPKVNVEDAAMWRRIINVPFSVSIPKEERNPMIKKHLTDLENGAKAIFSWLIEGCLIWQREGLRIPKIVTDCTNEYREEMDLLKDFFDDCCIVNPLAKVTNSGIWEKYEKWCHENGEKFPLGRRKFTNYLETRGFIQERSSSARWWKGIGIKENVYVDDDKFNNNEKGKVLTLRNDEELSRLSKVRAMQDQLF